MTTHTPDNEHVAFDAMCAQVEDYQTLPGIPASTPESAREAEVAHDAEAAHEHRAAPLNEMILAGLVSP
jgi:hypothetical protein